MQNVGKNILNPLNIPKSFFGNSLIQWMKTELVNYYRAYVRKKNNERRKSEKVKDHNLYSLNEWFYGILWKTEQGSPRKAKPNTSVTVLSENE